MSSKIDSALYLKEQRKLLYFLLCPDSPELTNWQAAQQLITSYKKMEPAVRNQLNLLLTALEAGTAFLNEIPNMDENYYDAMMGFWNDFEALMAPQYLEEFQDELLVLRKKSQALDGCGYDDHVQYITAKLLNLEDEE